MEGLTIQFQARCQSFPEAKASLSWCCRFILYNHFPAHHSINIHLAYRSVQIFVLPQQYGMRTAEYHAHCVASFDSAGSQAHISLLRYKEALFFVARSAYSAYLNASLSST
jgi:hypothetical protein